MTYDSDRGNRLAVPNPAWSRNIPNLATTDGDRDIANWNELDRWATDMLKKGWPGSGAIRRPGSTNAGGVVGPVAIGGNAASGPAFTGIESQLNAKVVSGYTQMALVVLNMGVQPLTVPLGVLNCTVNVVTYNAAGGLIGAVYAMPYVLAASAAGDSYPLVVTLPISFVSGGASGYGVQLVVAGASAQACQLTYATQYFI